MADYKEIGKKNPAEDVHYHFCRRCHKQWKCDVRGKRDLCTLRDGTYCKECGKIPLSNP